MATNRRQTAGVSILTATFLSLSTLTIVVDLHTDYLQTARNLISYPILGAQYVANAPTRIVTRSFEFFSDRRELILRMEQLELDIARLAALEQRMIETEQTNAELRQTLGVSNSERDFVLLASEIVSVIDDGSRNEVIVNRGTSDGVEVGMAVLNQVAAFGQVVETLPSTSRVILVTDARHSIPTQIQRTRTWTIVSGTGRGQNMKIEHPSVTSDIEVGDVLLTSGLGGVFPSGYLVGVVIGIQPDASGQLLDVTVDPFAKLETGRWLLIVLSERSE